MDFDDVTVRRRRDKTTSLRNRGLAQYYEKTQSSPDNIDSPDFDPGPFTKKLLRQDLRTLLAEDKKLVSEIKTLDANMKTLVYENYSKFISAADTINKVLRAASLVDFR